MTVCPRCGARATYVGVLTVECATRGCPNYREPPPEPPKAPKAAATNETPIGQEEASELMHDMLEGGFF